MLFPTTEFALFFAATLLLWWGVPGSFPRVRKFILLAANIAFYCVWSWRFALLLLATAAVNHGLAILAARRHAPGRAAAVAVAVNLALLAFFKYAGFLFASFVAPAGAWICGAFLPPEAAEAWADFQFDHAFPFISSIILPIGISFTTFSAIAYVVDAARGTFRPAKSLLDCLNYFAFFPKLCAGPIVRPADILPDLEEPPAALPGSAKSSFARAIVLVAVGLLKKTIVANVLAQRLVDPVFTGPEGFGAIDALLAVYGYTIQIYCDFSAYTDIAIAVALLMGFRLPINFDAPYIATSLQGFWRGWHISLSTWLRDYLYIPMGGSRCAKWRVNLNLVVTMLLGGLWHGAGWTYILWGAIHGVAQVIERPFNRKRAPGEPGPSRAILFLRGLVTFHVVAFAWIFFRAGAGDVEGMRTVSAIFSAFRNWAAPATLCSATIVVMLVLGFVAQFADADRLAPVVRRFARLPAPLLAIAAALVLTIVLGFGPRGIAPFIYFQF